MRRYILGLAVTTIATLSPAWASAGDQESAQQIAQALRNSGRLVDYSIGVKYHEGTAYLKGRVRTREQMIDALQVVEGLPEVTQVVNQLDVQPSTDVAQTTNRASEGEPLLRMRVPSAANETAQLQAAEMLPEATPEAAPSSLAKRIAGTVRNFTQRDSAVQPVGMPALTMEQRDAGTPAQPIVLAPPAQSQYPDGTSARRTAATQPIAAAPAPFYPNTVRQMPNQAMPMQQGYPMPAQGQYAAQQQQQPGYYMTGGMQQPIPSAGGGPIPAYVPGMGGGVSPARYDQPNLPGYAWPSYTAHPNYAGLTYPKQYSPTAWPYIGPFYPYPQVPLGWRKVTLEWDDGWWMLDFDDR